MNWLAIALTGHLLNAVAFIVDKTLLSSAFKRSGTYAGMIGCLSLIAFLGLPFIHTWPPLALLPAIAAFGGFYVFALWLFFEALKHEEATRVIPIVGSLIPVFTFAATYTFFHERLTRNELIGFVFLLIATWLLTGSGSKRRAPFSLRTFLVALFSAVLFAASSVFWKYAFYRSDFFTVFVLSRTVTGMLGLAIALGLPTVRREIRSIFRKHGGRPASSALAILGQLSGGIGFVLVHLSIAKGSAAIVNALQAVQYAGIILVAWFGGKKLRELLNEEVNVRIVVLKLFAILSVGVGLFLIA